MKQYDVIIAGGGVIGAACAYFLSRDTNLKIALVDLKKPVTRLVHLRVDYGQLVSRLDLAVV